MLQALSGVRVLEVGPNLSAHYAGKLLGELGADIVKVEPVTGDPSRRRGPYVRDVPNLEGSALFLYANLDKRGVTLDRSTPTGQEILARLAGSADVVLWGDEPARGRSAFQSFSPWSGKVWQLVSPFGATGPHTGWKAQGVSLYHAGGEGYLLPGGATYPVYPDREPIKGPGYLGEFSGGLVIAAGALVGLLLYEQGSGPLLIDTSVQEALLQFVMAELSQHADEGKLPSRAARAPWPGGLVPASDGWVVVMPLEQRMWESLVEFMGNPEWTRKYANDVDRRSAGAEIANLMSAWTSRLPKNVLYREGQARGIAVGEVLTIAELLASPQLVAREFFVEVDHPYAGKLKYSALPWRLAPDQVRCYRPAPLLGQHNVEILHDELGFSRREVVALYEAGII